MKPNMSEDARALSILYKRRGHFDAQRDKLLRQFQQTERHKELLETVKGIVSEIVHKNPDLLLKNKGQIAALVEGVISLRNTDVEGVSNDVDVYELFEEEVKQSTIGSEELRESIRRQLAILKNESDGEV